MKIALYEKLCILLSVQAIDPKYEENITDLELLSLVAKGDTQAFRSLYDRYW